MKLRKGVSVTKAPKPVTTPQPQQRNKNTKQTLGPKNTQTQYDINIQNIRQHLKNIRHLKSQQQQNNPRLNKENLIKNITKGTISDYPKKTPSEEPYVS